MKTTMKKKYLIFAAAALTLAACSNDDENLNGGPVELRLSSSLEVQTRAATDIQGSAFETGQSVDVFIHEHVTSGAATTTYPQPLVYTTGASGAMTPSTQPYFPSSGNGVTICAYYPSDMVDNIDAGTTATFTVKDDQSLKENYMASDLMYGVPQNGNPVKRTTDAVGIGFTHLLSKVSVNLTAGDGNPNLTGATVELLNVLPTTTLTTAEGSISEATGAATDITVFTADATTSKGSAIVPPQTLGAQFVKVTLADGGELIGKLNDSSTPDLKGGNEYTYNITVNLTALSITATITPWGDGDTLDGSATMQ